MEKRFSKNCKKGEKGIVILAPMKFEKEIEVEKNDITGKKIKEKEIVRFMSFKPTVVFDISQTVGKEIKDLNIANELKFEVKNFDLFMKEMKNIAPCKIVFDDISNGRKDYYSLTNDEIIIKSGMSKAQTIKTLIHETSHAILYKNGTAERHTAEIQAASIGYIVCHNFGIDTSDYSFPYLATWSKDKKLEELKSSLEIIRNTSNNIIETLEKAINKNLNLEVERKSLKDKIKEAQQTINYPKKTTIEKSKVLKR